MTGGEEGTEGRYAKQAGQVTGHPMPSQDLGLDPVRDWEPPGGLELGMTHSPRTNISGLLGILWE